MLGVGGGSPRKALKATNEIFRETNEMNQARRDVVMFACTGDEL